VPQNVRWRTPKYNIGGLKGIRQYIFQSSAQAPVKQNLSELAFFSSFPAGHPPRIVVKSWYTLRKRYATLQGMDISPLPLREKIHNFHKNASILKIKVTFYCEIYALMIRAMSINQGKIW
jgi:hypothetical protein